MRNSFPPLLICATLRNLRTIHEVSEMKGERSAPVTKGEWTGLAVLLSVILVALKISWLKWSDPVIDFRREVYLPWRISEGAVLYRDTDAAYGPLSQWFNALVFRITGPGLMHLVAVNLAIHAVQRGVIILERKSR
jgi:hypothetical protein